MHLVCWAMILPSAITKVGGTRPAQPMGDSPADASNSGIVIIAVGGARNYNEGVITPMAAQGELLVSPHLSNGEYKKLALSRYSGPKKVHALCSTINGTLEYCIRRRKGTCIPFWDLLLRGPEGNI